MAAQHSTSGSVAATEIGPVSSVDGYQVEIITSLARLEDLLPEWQTLIEAAYAPAQCQEPAWVLSARRHFPDIKSVQTIAIWSPVRSMSGSRNLVGMVTLKPAGWLGGVALGPLKTSVHNHVFDGTPLLHEDHGAGALEALLRHMPKGLLIESLPDQKPFMDMLTKAALAAGCQVHCLERFERGVYSCNSPVKDYLEQNHSRNRRNKFRKWRSRLSNSKTLECVHIQPGEDLKPWLDAFFELEARGWKGLEGTAVANSPADSGFFEEALTALHHEGKLVFWKLVLEDKPVSMLFGIRHHRHIGLGKFTYDEEYSRYSPGTLLLLDVMEHLTGEKETDFIDACGRPGNLMIDALWHERLVVSDYLISAPGCSKAVFWLQCVTFAVRRTLRTALKPLYHRLKSLKHKA